MKKPDSQPANGQGGFIPMIILIIVILVAVIFFAYQQVIKAQN